MDCKHTYCTRDKNIGFQNIKIKVRDKTKLYQTFLISTLRCITHNYLTVYIVYTLYIIISVVPKGRSFIAGPGTQAAVFLHPTLFLTSEQTLKDLKSSQGLQSGGEENGFSQLGPSGLHRNSPQGLNISFKAHRTKSESVAYNSRPCSSSAEYSAQGQVLYCKLRNQGRSSAQRQIFNRKLSI